jgi:hypothetical protein
MRWVTPLLLVGTAAEAEHRGEVYATTPDAAMAAMKVRHTAVVPNREMAAEVIRRFGASEEWIRSHVLSEWGPGHIDAQP